MKDVTITMDEAEKRLIKRSDYVSCNVAFIDCKTPGSHLKENYSLIGPGVTSSADQVINLREPHGFNIGAAAMPNGITNNLHIHFTAEVFLCFKGEWKFRWGPNGDDGEIVGQAGDIVSVPTTAGSSPRSAATIPAASSGTRPSSAARRSTVCTCRRATC